jgi:hypothetical protein
LCQIWLQLALQFWRRSWKCKSLTDRRQTDRRTTYNGGSEKVTWTFSSGALKPKQNPENNAKKEKTKTTKKANKQIQKQICKKRKKDKERKQKHKKNQNMQKTKTQKEPKHAIILQKARFCKISINISCGKHIWRWKNKQTNLPSNIFCKKCRFHKIIKICTYQNCLCIN